MVGRGGMGHVRVRLRVRYRGAPAALVDEREAPPSLVVLAGEAVSPLTTCSLILFDTRPSPLALHRSIDERPRLV